MTIIFLAEFSLFSIIFNKRSGIIFVYIQLALLFLSFLKIVLRERFYPNILISFINHSVHCICIFESPLLFCPNPTFHFEAPTFCRQSPVSHF